jgi:hypothetical protein
MGIECWGKSKEKKTLNNLNETLERKDGKSSLKDSSCTIMDRRECYLQSYSIGQRWDEEI